MSQAADAGTGLIERLAGIPPGSAVAEALAARASILRLSQESHDAVLLPREPGGLSHGLRAALAARMARLNAEPALATHYDALLEASGERQALAPIAAPAERPQMTPRLTAVTRHADLLTRAPRHAKRSDIEALKVAGISEPDIVRLSELAAFVSYQVRVIAGLKLLRDAR